MKNTVITVGGVTRAMKLQKLFSRNKIPSRVIKVAPMDSDSGCTHGVEISDADLFRSVVLMRENGISYRLYSG